MKEKLEKIQALGLFIAFFEMIILGALKSQGPIAGVIPFLLLFHLFVMSITEIALALYTYFKYRNDKDGNFLFMLVFFSYAILNVIYMLLA